jgi:hypothetical protein
MSRRIRRRISGFIGGNSIDDVLAQSRSRGAFAAAGKTRESWGLRLELPAGSFKMSGRSDLSLRKKYCSPGAGQAADVSGQPIPSE